MSKGDEIHIRPGAWLPFGGPVSVPEEVPNLPRVLGAGDPSISRFSMPFFDKIPRIPRMTSKLDTSIRNNLIMGLATTDRPLIIQHYPWFQWGLHFNHSLLTLVITNHHYSQVSCIMNMYAPYISINKHLEYPSNHPRACMNTYHPFCAIIDQFFFQASKIIITYEPSITKHRWPFPQEPSTNDLFTMHHKSYCSGIMQGFFNFQDADANRKYLLLMLIPLWITASAVDRSFFPVDQHSG